MDTATAEHLVGEAIEFLDFIAKNTNNVFFPENWREGIDLEDLKMSVADKCILGQLGEPFGCEYSDMADEILYLEKIEFPDHLQYILHSLQAYSGVPSGFAIYMTQDETSPAHMDNYERLTQAWIKALSEESWEK